SLRNDVLTVLGGTRIVMPHLEELATRSLVMTRAYANATLSAYADPSVVSSQHPLRSWNYRSYPDPVPYPRVLLWDLLAPRGYATAIISSQNEHWGGMLNFLHTPSLGYVFHGETFHQSYVPDGEAGFAEWAAQFKRSGKVDDADTTTELIRYVRETKQPFVVYANFQNSHFPYRYPEPGPFQPSQVDFHYTFFAFPRDKIDVVKNRYHNALHFIDAQLGRLFSALKETGAWDNTIIAIAGDNGEAFLEHGVAGHGTTPYEELIRVPVILHAPGLEAQVSDRLSQHLDLVPTILSLLGMPAHPGFQGASMLSGEKPATPIFSVVQITTIRELAVIDGTWKLIADGETKREVYDLATDPAEKNNLWGTDRKRDERLFNLLLSFRKAQLSYYSDPARWPGEYVPSLSP
ncbi:MAG TPA: sulfatase, partial [Polyangiaceae bacterium]|nr:sulfatase [Polyangiaceae bacterium]